MRKTFLQERPRWPILPAGILLVWIGSFAGPNRALAQTVVENPAKPKAANAGRVIVPEEVLAISDEGTSDYYFKNGPRGLTAAPDGSLLCRDMDQVLRFDKDGKFGRNFFKKGQGPGEVTYVGACLATDKNIIVHSTYPNKLIFFDYSGKYEREISARTETRSIMTALLFQGDVFYIHAWEFPRVKGDPDYIDVPHSIFALSEATGEFRKLSSFPTKSFVASSPGGGGGMFHITSLIAVPFQGKYLALSHTSEYLLKIYDPAGDKVVREFRRAYERVKPEPLTEEQKKGGIIIDGKHYTQPEQKFQNDVRNLLARGDEIWAVTSTKDKAKGVLIDVFDGEGVYRDCFWLKLPEAALKSVIFPGSCALDGEFLWVVERSEDETFAIKKYRVVV
ncbi:MAG TPA: 6-bladed beta-propeller [Candidatus Latescibacteria bacterium]|nr:6-bladed beta-propeller [Candidatus Latescibacterota bacterium]